MCRDKNNAVVEMTLPEDNTQILQASTRQFYRAKKLCRSCWKSRCRMKTCDKRFAKKLR
ncbi:MAG: hypothetical protein ACLUD2_05815 [Clostridium sp.]